MTPETGKFCPEIDMPGSRVTLPAAPSRISSNPPTPRRVFREATMPSLRLARSSQRARRLARWLMALIGLSLVLMAFAPWQQSLWGSGEVIAFSTNEREQVIESPIKGRLVRLGDGIFENARVHKDQLIAEIQDLDPELMSRLESQVTASRQARDSARVQAEANQRNLEAAQTIVKAYESQVTAYENVLTQVVSAAESYVEMAEQKVISEEQTLAELSAGLQQADLDLKRQKQLFEERIASQLKFQEAERKAVEAKAKVRKAAANIEGAKRELEAKQADRDAKEQKSRAEIEYAQAALRKSRGDVAKAESDIAKSQAEISKAEKELLEAESKLARQRNQQIIAPFDGFIVQIYPNQGSQVLKEGDSICRIVPDTDDRAVQLMLDGNDAPLVQVGRQVRLQFEGWPAIQFAGWPSVAIGTFGGTVASVDATDDGKGKFRVLIQPDESSQEWPEPRFLRQGVRASGWVLLDQVPLWFETWRRINGFPPVTNVYSEEGGKGKKGSKPPKVKT
jgi:multidrug resistance efflux pump